jgi:alkylation response protein AidB-like acyl-CoA dehydrogenase
MTTHEAAAEATLLDAARALRPLIEASADRIEADRQLTGPIIDAMAEAGLLTMLVPREFGGAQVDPMTALRAIEEVARADGSTGWCLMVAAVVGLGAGSLRRDVAGEIWGHRRAFVAGSITGSGTAVVVNGGFRVRGRWSFASGCRHATYLMALANVIDGDEPRLGPNGLPETRLAFFPADDRLIVDNWQVAGLRGTGSHDLVLDDLFVPEAYTLPRSYGVTPWHRDALYTYGAAVIPSAAPEQSGTSPWAGLSATGMGAALPGMARGAIDAFVELADGKTPFRRGALLKNDPVVQDRLGRAEARLQAARSLMYDTTAELWQTILETGAGAPTDQMRLRLAGAHIAETSVEVIQTVWKMGGTTGIWSGSALDRRLRDAQVGAQNVGVSPTAFGIAGQWLLSAQNTAT